MIVSKTTLLRGTAVALTLSFLSYVPPSAHLQAAAVTPPKDPTPATMQMSSPSFTDGGVAPDKHTCIVDNPVSPAFTWIDPPTKTVSYTLIFHVPDVHPNKGIDDSFHWAVWNIPGEARGLPEGMPATSPLPDGSRQTMNSHGDIGYSPMCGRPGKRLHYMFELYALDIKLDLPADAKRADIFKAMDGHIIGKNVYIGRFSRPGAVGPVAESSF